MQHLLNVAPASLSFVSSVELKGVGFGLGASSLQEHWCSSSWCSSSFQFMAGWRPGASWYQVLPGNLTHFAFCLSGMVWIQTLESCDAIYTN